MLKINQADVYTDFQGLAKLKNAARNESPEALKEVAKQFESIFLNMVLKSMREAKLADGIMDSSQSEFFQEMYDQQLAIHLSGDPGVGLAELIARQLSPENSTEVNEMQSVGDYRNHPVVSPVLFKPEVKGKLVEKPLALDDKKTPPVASDQTINSAEQFVKQLWVYAEQAGKELGVEPKLLLAQSALETGWGKAIINKADQNSSHNLFNIKANQSWSGQQAKVATLEYKEGVARKKMAGFRAYDSFQESFQDYVNFIRQNPRYHEALKHTDKPAQYMHELQKAGYATDPEYANKVMKIYHGKTLAQNLPEQIVVMNHAEQSRLIQ